MTRLLTTCLIAIILSACTASPQQDEKERPFSGSSPWPDIRLERIQTLLPEAMMRAEVEAWAVLCRSNTNDPLALHIGCENTVAPAVYLFDLISIFYRSVQTASNRVL